MLYWKFPLWSHTEKSPVCGPFFIQMTADFIFLRIPFTRSRKNVTFVMSCLSSVLVPAPKHTHTVDTSVCQLQAEVEQHLKDERRGERLRSGVQVVIAGATNAGKSSLLNILCM